MSEAHTQGPWRVLDFSTGSRGFIAVVGPSQVAEHICDVFPFGSRPGCNKRELEQHLANAHLISAAPELLAALKAIVCEIRAYQSPECDDEGAPGAAELKAADAAIAKAEGRAS